MDITLLVMGFTVAFNFVIIVHKYRKSRFADATLDMALMAIICFLFSGSFDALATGTVASMLVSIYLFIHPVRMPKIFESDD